MRNFLATVLSVIALGVMLIAYGLLSPRVAASDGSYYQARPMIASERVDAVQDLTVRRPMAYPVSDLRAAPAYDAYQAPRRASYAPRRASYEPRRTSYEPSYPRTTRSAPVGVERSSGRDWTKTAMVIGGTTAAGAGLGAIFGGKKGALIGAAIGGGAGTIYEVRKR